VLHNASCQFRIWKLDQKMDYLARNGDGDDLFFVHEGAGELFCDYGHLTIREGDYIVVPRSTSWRIEPSSPITMIPTKIRSVKSPRIEFRIRYPSPRFAATSSATTR
jgi:homogentisate 1,2-dioxygenase